MAAGFYAISPPHPTGFGPECGERLNWHESTLNEHGGMRDNRVMRYGRVLILAAAVMAAALLAVSCGAESAPLVVPTATQGPSPTPVPPTEPPPTPTVAPAATPTVEVVEEPEDLVLPVISEKQHELIGTQEWINSDPLTLEGLADEGKVVLVDFWTYT